MWQCWVSYSRSFGVLKIRPFAEAMALLSSQIHLFYSKTVYFKSNRSTALQTIFPSDFLSLLFTPQKFIELNTCKSNKTKEKSCLTEYKWIMCKVMLIFCIIRLALRLYNRITGVNLNAWPFFHHLFKLNVNISSARIFFFRFKPITLMWSVAKFRVYLLYISKQ